MDTGIWQSTLVIHKPQTQQTMQSNSFNPISAGAQMSIKAFYHDFSCQREQSQACLSYAECSRDWRETHFVNYMAENYSATPHQLMLDWNSVGATARYHGHNRTFEFRLWERSEGHLGIPDMTVIVSVFYISGLVTNAQAEADAVSLWLRDAAKANGFRHIATKTASPSPPAKSPAAASPASAYNDA